MHTSHGLSCEQIEQQKRDRAAQKAWVDAKEKKDRVEEFERQVRQNSPPVTAARYACSPGAFGRVPDKEFNECLAFLQPYVDKAVADGEVRAIAEKRNEEQRNLDDLHERELARKKEQATIAKFVADGDHVSMRRDCTGRYVSQDCVEKSFAGRDDLLRRRAATPKTCREVGLFNGYDKNDEDPMRVGLELKKTPGMFVGKVAQIDGRTLVIQNRVTLNNAIVNIGGAQVFSGSSVAVGTEVIGYGTQSGVRQASLVNGTQASIPVIAALCIGLRD